MRMSRPDETQVQMRKNVTTDLQRFPSSDSHTVQ